MAANYWVSSQRLHWLFSREQLATIRKKLEDEEPSTIIQYPLPERRLLNIYFNQQLNRLGRRIQVRQQALATAQVYVKRFYTKVDIRRTNPYLVVATAFYLACKMEECPQHIRVVVGEARNMWPDFIISDTAKLGECEFSLISEMNSQLIVHHPYRSLLELQSTYSVSADETALAWSIINDHYLTDLPLLYPPHVIAITAIFLAITLKPTQMSLHAAATSSGGAASLMQNATSSLGSNVPGRDGVNQSNSPQTKSQKLINSLAESDIDMEDIIDCIQEIISLYEVWDQYNDKVCKEQITRFIKARGLDK